MCLVKTTVFVFFVLLHSASRPDACLHFTGWKVCPDPSYPHPRFFKVSLFRLFDALCDALIRENLHVHEFGKNFYFTLFTQCVCYIVYPMCLLCCLPNVFVTLFTKCVCYVVYQMCLCLQVHVKKCIQPLQPCWLWHRSSRVSPQGHMIGGIGVHHFADGRPVTLLPWYQQQAVHCQASGKRGRQSLVDTNFGQQPL